MQLMLKTVDLVLDAEDSFSAYSAMKTCVHVSDNNEQLRLPPLINTTSSTLCQNSTLDSMKCIASCCQRVVHKQVAVALVCGTIESVNF